VSVPMPHFLLDVLAAIVSLFLLWVAQDRVGFPCARPHIHTTTQNTTQRHNDQTAALTAWAPGP
jgi:hypothetical protein